MPDPLRKTVSATGLHLNVSHRDYHADPCPEPSLSRSIAKTLIERTPRHAYIAHPRLSGASPGDDGADKFNIGKVAHELILGRGGAFVVIDALDWRTNAAKAKRDETLAEGMTPILARQMDAAVVMQRAVMDQLPAFGLKNLFDKSYGQPEVVGMWRDEVAGWCRFMADWITTDLTIWDVKTTAIPISPEIIGRHCSQMGYEFQQAFYERGMEAIHPELAGRVRFNFLFVEIAEPFAVLPVRLPGDALAKGRHNVAMACEKWAECRARNDWPMFSGGVQTVDYPPWQVAEWADYADRPDES